MNGERAKTRQTLMTTIASLERELAEVRSSGSLGAKSRAVLLDFARRIDEAKKQLSELSVVASI